MNVEQTEIGQLDAIIHRIVRKSGRLFGMSPEQIDQCHVAVSCKIFPRLPAIEPGKRENYVAKTARFEGRRYFWRQSRHKEWPLDGCLLEDTRSSSIGDDFRHWLLLEGIPRLPSDQRELVEDWLRAGGRNSAVELWAERKGYSRATGYKRLRKAKDELRSFILAQEG